MTNYPHGLASFGAPVLPQPGISPHARHWFVDGGSAATEQVSPVGSDGNTGKAPGKAFLTMAKAFTMIRSGDVIWVRGNVREQITAPAGVFDVTIIGCGNRPRHADANTQHTLNGGYSSVTWKTPASATTAPLLTLYSQGWRIVNILFAGPTDSDCILLKRTAEGASEQDSSHAEFIGCRFASGYNAINDTGGCYGVMVKNCRFGALTNFCILGVGNIGVGQSEWIIEDNHFQEFTNGIKIAAFQCRVTRNTFTDGGTPNTTVVCNMTNGGGGNNFIVDNWFQTATANFNTPDVVGAATDVWFNVSIDSFTAGLESGHEVGRPA